MKRRLMLLILLLTTVGIRHAIGQWDWERAPTQAFQSIPTSTYVTAVGTEDKLEVVSASQIEAALIGDKEIRLKYAQLEDDLSLHPNELQQPVYFIHTTFSGKVSFRGTRFKGVANFSYAKFSDTADFSHTEFSSEANFNAVKFFEAADFYATQFSKEAFFRSAEFSEEATFISSRFDGDARFESASFSEGANFNAATFTQGAFFSFSKLERADFNVATFSDRVSFNAATFSGDTRFSECRFRRSSDFQKSLFETDSIDFSGVTDFSKMQIEWKGGLKGRIEYDHTFYIALIQNYSALGLWDDADDVYYTYREAQRKRRSNPFLRGVELLFLKIPFGYGVKPENLLVSFVILWLAFSWVYVGLLRSPEEGIISPSIHAWNPTRFRWPSHLKCFSWALAYSFDAITPGIDFPPFTDMLLKWSGYRFKSSKAAIWLETLQSVLGWYLLALFLILFGKIWIR